MTDTQSAPENNGRFQNGVIINKWLLLIDPRFDAEVNLK